LTLSTETDVVNKFDRNLEFNLRSKLNDILLRTDQAAEVEGFFDFTKECISENLIKTVTQVYLFEELFESSAPMQLETNFKLFCKHVNEYGLYEII